MIASIEKPTHKDSVQQLNFFTNDNSLPPCTAPNGSSLDTDSSKLKSNSLGIGLLGKITEIITSGEKTENYAMLLPLLATLSKDDRWFAWISPPKNIPRSLLIAAGIDLDKVMLLHPDEHNSTLMLSKKALSAGTCHAVISWEGALSEHELSNLEQSARAGASHGIVIRNRN